MGQKLSYAGGRKPRRKEIKSSRLRDGGGKSHTKKGSTFKRARFCAECGMNDRSMVTYPQDADMKTGTIDRSGRCPAHRDRSVS